METLEDILYLLIPLLLFYFIGLISNAVKKSMKGLRRKAPRRTLAVPDALQRREKTLATKRGKGTRLQSTLHAEVQRLVQANPPAPPVWSEEDEAEWASEEEMIEHYGMQEYERLVHEGKLPVPVCAGSTASVPPAGKTHTRTGRIRRMSARDMIIAAEILERPLALRRGRR